MIGLILLQIALIALNAVFAGTEIAVISVNEAKLEKEEELYFAQNDGELIFGDELTQYKNLEAEELG